jgi:hypothetical protein
MSFERLPLALALSITLLGGGLLADAGMVQARPLLEGQTSCSGYNLDDSKTMLIAAKDSDDVSADSPAKDKTGSTKDKNGSAKDKNGSTRDKNDSAREEKSASKKSKSASSKEDNGDKDSKQSKKASSDEKGGKDKKALKAEKASAKENARETAEENGEKKKGRGGFFHKHNSVEEEKTKAEESVPETSAQSKKEAAAEQEATRAKNQGQVPPVFVPDDALISVLKDINKALADSQTEQVQKISNVNERMILGLCQEIFTKALGEPNLTANRIVPKDEEHQVKTSLSAESWSSGDVVVSDNLRGSMAAVWAKRVGGLLTVTVAGDAGQRKTPDGTPIGEFMVVVTAHSPVQSGFDIQSQGDVTFWMGKLNNITIEANCVPTEDTASNPDKPQSPTSNADTASQSPAGGGEAKKKSITYISPLLTNRYRKHYEVLQAADRESKLAAAQLATAAEQGSASGEGPMAGDDARPAPTTASERAAGTTGTDASGKEVATARGDAAKGANTNGDENQIAMAASGGSSTAAVVDAGPHFHLPSPSSTLLMPERALAGQYVTVAFLDRGRAPEANVELSFNGASLATDSNGQAVYQIPDDTTPGRTLNIALSARPDEVPATIEVLQPLIATTGQAPRLDRMTPLAIKDSIMTVDGHNFDGLAHNNSVIVDGSLEGRIVSASPFQLKLLLPQGLRPGPHSLCVSTDGQRSNLGGFDYADTLVTVDGKDTGKENSNVKLLVKVIGTTAKMNVKILNQTPDIIRLNRGAEITVTSSGGIENTIQLPAVRAKKGAFSIDTQIEM